MMKTSVSHRRCKPCVTKRIQTNQNKRPIKAGLLVEFEACSCCLQVHGEGRENPFRRKSSSRLLDPLVLALVQQIPGVGKVKALVLLRHFSSIQQLCNASPAELEPIVGQAGAQQIHSFFHKHTAGT